MLGILQRERLSQFGSLLLSYLLLIADFAWRCLEAVFKTVIPFVPWLLGLIALGISTGTIIVAAGFVVAQYGEILAIPVNPLQVAFVWGVTSLVFAIVLLGKLMLRIMGSAALSISSVLQDAAAQMSVIANRSQDRRRQPSIAKPVKPQGEGEFVPYSDEIGFQNEIAARMRSEGLSNENIAETLRQSGRTVNESEEETPFG